MEQNRLLRVSARELMPQVLSALDGGGKFVLSVTGGSMLPSLKPGRDQVELSKISVLRKGQILLFRRQTGEYILHRVVKVLPDGMLRMNGDAQTWTEAIFPEQAVAVVTRLCRKGRWYPCGTAADKCYATLWGLTRPIRGVLFKAYAALSRGAKKLRG